MISMLITSMICGVNIGMFLVNYINDKKNLCRVNIATALSVYIILLVQFIINSQYSTI